MNFSRTIILLPCHSLEDFPLHASGADADSLLANWTLGWHPRLISTANHIPEWRSTEHPPVDVTNALVLVPTLGSAQLPKRFGERAEKSGAFVVRDATDRQSILGAMVASGWDPGPDDLTDDFFALGYATLQVQLMTRRLRGSSNLDEEVLNEMAVRAANRVDQQDWQQAKQELSNCLDLLLQEKNSYYPVQPEIIDLILTTPKTLGPSLREQLAEPHPQSCLMTGETLIRAKQDHPETWQRLEDKVARNQLTIASGLQHELNHTRMLTESMVNQVLQFRHTLQHTLNRSPSVFARRLPGITSELPTILEQCHFSGALHTRFTPCKFPYHSTGNIRWESNDGRSILALSQEPKDANAGQTFLNLGVFIGERIDSAHLSTVLLAHWPGKSHPAMDDLKRINAYVPLFGSFVTLDDFFDSIYDPGYGETYTAADYQNDDLNSDVEQGVTDPLSRWTRYWERIYRLNSARTLMLMNLFQADANGTSPAGIQDSFSKADQLQTDIELATRTETPGIEGRLRILHTEQIEQLKTWCTPSNNVAVVNSTWDTRTGCVQTGQQGLAFLDKETSTFAESVDAATDWSVPVKSTSVTRLLDAGVPDSLASQPKLVDGHTLQNEFFAIEIDPERGGILNLHPHNRRNPLFSQRLALRIPAENDPQGMPITQSRYAEMVVEDLEVVRNSRVVGQVRTRGAIIDRDQPVARFEQEIQIVRGRRIADLQIRLDPLVELPPSKGHYFCSRFAWNENAFDLVRSAQELRAVVDGQWIEAPNFLEFVDPKHQVTLFPCGQNFHRRLDPRKLDTVLVVAGESRRSFRFGIGLNVPYAMGAAIDLMTPVTVIEGYDPPPEAESLFRLDRKNVIVTWCCPLFNDRDQLTGIQLRIRETQGRSGQLQIACPRELASAAHLNLLNEYQQDISVSENIATINYQSFDYLPLQLNWNP